MYALLIAPYDSVKYNVVGTYLSEQARGPGHHFGSLYTQLCRADCTARSFVSAARPSWLSNQRAGLGGSLGAFHSTFLAVFQLRKTNQLRSRMRKPNTNKISTGSSEQAAQWPIILRVGLVFVVRLE